MVTFPRSGPCVTVNIAPSLSPAPQPPATPSPPARSFPSRSGKITLATAKWPSCSSPHVVTVVVLLAARTISGLLLSHFHLFLLTLAAGGGV